MKLIAKYNRLTMPVIIGVFLVSSLAYYFIIHYVLISQLDKDLEVEKKEIIRHVAKTGSLPETSNFKDQVIQFQPTELNSLRGGYSTEQRFGPEENEQETYRKIEFLIRVKGQNYRAKVLKSQQETEDIIQLILVITIAVIAFLLMALFLSSRFMLQKLWKPFNDTLGQIKQFNFSSKNSFVPTETEISEFKELNKTALSLLEKISSDYESLKNFTENASHEIQTPLAIIKNKTELLAQMENLDESQVNLIQGIHEAASRLSRLNQSLLLLAKIENRQFKITEKIDLSAILSRLVRDFEELASAKSIRIEKQITENVFLEMNESLAEILISNLLLNAIKHNYIDGEMTVFLDSKSLSVVNTGTDSVGDASYLFQRFAKNSVAPDSLGLGLSIVKSICDACDFRVSYFFKDGNHTLRIEFT
ncbi:MAG: HAMP domain-containing sensor histidine kinase [Ginsengibacter sp.]